jgi:hypothetical protein
VLPEDRDGLQLDDEGLAGGACGLLHPARLRAGGHHGARGGPDVSALPLGQTLTVFAEIFVPEPPTVFSADGRQHLSHELFITNASGTPWGISRIQIVAGDRVLLDATGEALRGSLTHWPRTEEPAGSDVTQLPVGGRALYYAWVDLEDRFAPLQITHRVTFRPVSGGPELTIETEPVAVKSGLVTTAAPFRGTDWVAVAGPSNDSRHRRAVVPLDGVPRVPQRFAIDWLQIDSAGNTFKGDPATNELLRVREGGSRDPGRHGDGSERRGCGQHRAVA